MKHTPEYLFLWTKWLSGSTLWPITNSLPCAASRELVNRGEGVMGDEGVMSDED
jgi:hypothetical protein